MGDIQAALDKKEGPCLILAGAGTGKTQAIVEKMRLLIQSGACDPEKIVCITFSNEAANNLLLRVGKMVQLPDKREPIIRTFHAFSAEILRSHGTKIGLSDNFKILDPDQAMVLLHRNLKVHVNYCQKYVATIGTAKDLGITIEEFKKYLEKNTEEYRDIEIPKRIESLNFELQTLHLRKASWQKKLLVEEIKKLRNILEIKRFVIAWGAYEKLKSKGNYQDYSDLNANALDILRKYPEISHDYSYIIVDEFQDTNKLQLDFLVKLASHKNITVVGDMNQSIYRFRGAYSKNLSLFKEAFGLGERDIFTLSRSYRSPNKILRTAHQLISKNYSSSEECFFVENAHQREGEEIQIFEMKDLKEEARKVIEIIKEEQSKGVPSEEICVIFRTHQYGRIIKRALEVSNIPYCSVSRSSLLKQHSVKVIHDYLMIIDKIKREDSGGEQAWWDLLYLMRFSSEDLMSLGKVIQSLSKERKKERDSSEPQKDLKPFSLAFLDDLKGAKLSDEGKLAVKILLDKIQMMIPLMSQPLSKAIQEIYRISGILSESKTFEDREAMLNLQKFYDLAKTHEDLYDAEVSNFLYYLEVIENLGIEIEAARLEEEGVRLMTCHATKGLEYKTVILTNFAQGRFPIERYVGNSLIPTELLPEVKEEIKQTSSAEAEEYIQKYERHHQMLEERRLAYVTFTRAKERLYITYAREYGGKKFYPSIFLEEISYIKNPDISYVKDESQLYVEENETKTTFHFASSLESSNFENVLKTLANETGKEKEKVHRLSPSALLLFDECQKEFEYKYVYHMPERKTFSWEAMQLGSFVHLVLERGVASLFQRVDDFLYLAKQLSMEEEWSSISLPEAETLIRVFFERNKGRYDSRTRTEQFLPLTLAGIPFMGFADRIDVKDDGVEIIDYKTGKTAISPRSRDWQLGFYAIAAQERFGKVKKVVLEMLKQEKPLEFEFDAAGNAHCISSKWIDGFNLVDVRNQLIEAAQAIQGAYASGFKPCNIEKNCEFCNEYVYGL
ncbi:ATP-dependent helicase [Candidatus Pacearchaeota archaeon]|nr:ATP-dependent helicase [Candidatus Pacearchaeota archaeon]